MPHQFHVVVCECRRQELFGSGGDGALDQIVSQINPHKSTLPPMEADSQGLHTRFSFRPAIRSCKQRGRERQSISWNGVFHQKQPRRRKYRDINTRQRKITEREEHKSRPRQPVNDRSEKITKGQFTRTQTILLLLCIIQIIISRLSTLLLILCRIWFLSCNHDDDKNCDGWSTNVSSLSKRHVLLGRHLSLIHI